MISAVNLIKHFPNTPRPVIDGVSLEIKNGEFVSMMGRSGSGKSTLLYLLSTLDRTFEGDILYDSKTIKTMGVDEIHQLRNKQIGFVFQFHYLLSEFTALENVMMPSRKAKDPKDKAFKIFALHLLKEVGLEGKENSFPGGLSGGEQQRVAVARALMMKPTYLFADEPTGNLDTISGELVMRLFSKFNKEYGTTIVYVTHDQDFANLAPRKINLLEGKIVDR